MRPRFALGRTVATPAALKALRDHDINPLHLLLRHHNADWGDLSADDKAANDAAIRDGNRILSKYVIPNAGSFYVITEGDRSATTLMKVEDY